MKFKTLEGSETIKFLNPNAEDVFTAMFDFDAPCTGKHCAEHNPFSHVWTNNVRGTGKSFTTRVRCSGPNCQICEAFNED